MSRQLQALYPPFILDHGRHPRNRRLPEQFTHSALGDNPLCGDHMRVYLNIESGVIRDIAFVGESCALATASASLMTEALMGRAVAQADALRLNLLEAIRSGGVTRSNPAGAAGGTADVPALDALGAIAATGEWAARQQCTTLAWQALEAALAGGTSPPREEAGT